MNIQTELRMTEEFMDECGGIEAYSDPSSSYARTLTSAGSSVRLTTLANPCRACAVFDGNSGTVHGSKGREADFVIVLDLNDGTYGFPSKIEDDPVLALVLPSVGERAFPHAEERRLFYVAATRAKYGVHLVADSRHPSAFVREILSSGHSIRRIGAEAGEALPACPRCGGRLHTSRRSGGPACTHTGICGYSAPKCRECGSGFVLVEDGKACCTNPECDADVEVCPGCRSGLLRRREGPNGPFWGCTNYWSDPPCEFTCNIGPTHSRRMARRGDSDRFRGRSTARSGRAHRT